MTTQFTRIAAGALMLASAASPALARGGWHDGPGYYDRGYGYYHHGWGYAGPIIVEPRPVIIEEAPPPIIIREAPPPIIVREAPPPVIVQDRPLIVEEDRIYLRGHLRHRYKHIVHHAYEVGRPISGDYRIEEVPVPILDRLRPVPQGFRYVRVDDDVLLLSRAGVIADVVTLR